MNIKSKINHNFFPQPFDLEYKDEYLKRFLKNPQNLACFKNREDAKATALEIFDNYCADALVTVKLLNGIHYFLN